MSPLVTNANLLVANLNTNVTSTLVNLSDISSNLDLQVERDTNMLEGISKTVTDYDAFVLGLEHHWLLRSAFKKTNTNSNIKETQSPPPSHSLKTPRQGGITLVFQSLIGRQLLDIKIAYSRFAVPSPHPGLNL